MLSSTDKWTVVGEWTGAQTDCAKWLNGLGVGARYDGTYSTSQGGSSQVGSCDGKFVGTVDGLSDDDKTNLRQLIEAQLDAYEAHTGWIFWTWKTESAPEWDMRNLTAAGVFPQPLTDRQCEYSPILIDIHIPTAILFPLILPLLFCLLLLSQPLFGSPALLTFPNLGTFRAHKLMFCASDRPQPMWLINPLVPTPNEVKGAEDNATPLEAWLGVASGVAWTLAKAHPIKMLHSPRLFLLSSSPQSGLGFGPDFFVSFYFWSIDLYSIGLSVLWITSIGYHDS